MNREEPISCLNLFKEDGLLEKLDPDRTGWIDIENIVSFRQKFLLRIIPKPFKSRVEAVLKNYVYKHKSFKMPTKVFIQAYSQQSSSHYSSPIKSRNPDTPVYSSPKSILAISNQSLFNDLTKTMNDKHLRTLSIPHSNRLGTENARYANMSSIARNKKKKKTKRNIQAEKTDVNRKFSFCNDIDVRRALDVRRRHLSMCNAKYESIV